MVVVKFTSTTTTGQHMYVLLTRTFVKVFACWANGKRVVLVVHYQIGH